MNYPFDERPSFRKGLGYIFLLTLLVLLFYWEGLGAHLDALEWTLIHQAVGLASKWYFDPQSYKPIWDGLVHLTYLSFGYNNPLPYHLVNLALYISTLLLLYLFYNLFSENKAVSKISLHLFATFYLHAEVVNQFTSNRELLRTLFGLVTLLYFSHYRKTHCLRYYALALLFGVLAYLSEETSVCLPLLLLAIDYHILHGVFPPGIQFLKDVRRGLLPHLPLFLLALSVLAYPFLMHSSPLYIDWTSDKTLHGILNQSYFLAIYTFAPCCSTDRLTIILGWIVIAGIGWLFYRSSPQRRSLIVTMIACTGFSLIPYTIFGPVPRYFTFSSVFSMFLIALLAFEMGSYIYGLLEKRLQVYHLSAERVITTLTVLILLPAIYSNYCYVKQYNRNVIYGGRLLREIIDSTAEILPQEPEEIKLLYINLPSTVESDLILCQDFFVAYRDFFFPFASDVYRCKHYIPKMERVKTIYLDLGYDRVSLDSRAWYVPVKAPFATVLSPTEFNTLSRDGKNKALFFNPVTNKLVDVSGWSYEELNRSIAPYRDKLSHAPPVEPPNSFADTSI